VLGDPFIGEKNNLETQIPTRFSLPRQPDLRSDWGKALGFAPTINSTLGSNVAEPRATLSSVVLDVEISPKNAYSKISSFHPWKEGCKPMWFR
jgi:hypothetical protein